MKIAFIVQKIAQRCGGAERVLVEAASAMAARGHGVEILSHENRGVGPFYELGEGTVHRNLFNRPIKHIDKLQWKLRERFRESLPDSVPGIRHYKWHLQNDRFITDLRRYIDQQKPDVLVPFMPPAMVACACAARGTGVPVVASTHNAPYQDFRNPQRWDSNPVDIRMRWQILEEMSRILVLLPEYREWYPPHLHKKIEVMPNPVAPVERDMIAGARRDKRLLFVGRLSKVKRPAFIMQVWKTLAKTFPDWRLDMFGDGPMAADLRRLRSTPYDPDTAASIGLKGVTQSIHEAYLSSSLLVHPAEYEGFPLAVAEALAHGLPVVGFKSCSGLNALVTDGENGVLVEGGDDDDKSVWAETLHQLLSSPGTIETLSQNAPASVARYAPKLVYDKWEKVLQTCVAERRLA